MPTTLKSKLNARLRTLAADRGVTLDRLSEQIGLGKDTLRQWTKSKYGAPTQILSLVAVADLAGVSLDWLTGRSDEMGIATGRADP